MARSKSVAAIEVVWLAAKQITRQHPLTLSEALVSMWIHPERLQLHELTTAAVQMLRGSPQTPMKSAEKYITTHVAIHNGTQAIWVVQLWPEGPVLRYDCEGLQARVCYFPDRETFKAALAILPIERWEAETFHDRLLQEGK